jgi:WD40 repeat protein
MFYQDLPKSYQNNRKVVRYARYICIIKLFLQMRYQLSPVAILMCIMVVFNNQLYAQSFNNKEILWTADWSPNGKYIAVAGNSDTIVIYNSHRMMVFKKIPFGSTVTRVKWHPSKNILAIISQSSIDKSAILNIDTESKIELEGISSDGARAMDWNESGDHLAVGDNDGHIFIFDVQGKLQSTFHHENSKSITSLDWHPSKDMIVTVGDKIRLFDIAGNLMKSIKHRSEDVLLLGVAWHPTGDLFVTGDYGDEINKPWLQFWSVQGQLKKTIVISKGEYRNLAWNQKGNRLATASDALRIWDHNGKLKYEGTTPDYLWGLSWSPSFKKIVTSSIKQNISIWNDKAKKILDL